MNTSLFEVLDRNTKGITGLLKDLSAMMERLFSMMREKHTAREHMTEEQIKAFTNFRRFYDSEAIGLYEELSRLSALKRKAVSELMATDADYAEVYSRLSSISIRQDKTIESINEIITAAGSTLELIS